MTEPRNDYEREADARQEAAWADIQTRMDKRWSDPAYVAGRHAYWESQKNTAANTPAYYDALATIDSSFPRAEGQDWIALVNMRTQLMRARIAVEVARLSDEERRRKKRRAKAARRRIVDWFRGA